MNDTTQAAATDANAQPQADAAATGAQTENANDLSSFLEEYERTVAPQQPATTTQPAPQAQQPSAELSAALSVINEFRQERALARDEADTAKAIKTVKGDLDMSDYAVEGFLHQLAREQPTVQKIWRERDQNPAAFNRMLANAGKELAKREAERAKRPDPNATADREAVSAAVRGASGRAPEDAPKNYGKMSDADLRQEMLRLGVNPTF